MRTAIKRFVKSLDEGDKEAALQHYRVAVSNTDMIARKGLEHKNTAARLKSRLNARLKTLVTA